jgi:hypothetical protein
MRAHWSSVSSWNRDTIPGFQNPTEIFVRHALVGQATALPGGAFATVNRRVHSLSHGQSCGRCSLILRAEVATRAGTLTSFAGIIAVVTFLSLSPATVAAARVRLNLTCTGR